MCPLLVFEKPTIFHIFETHKLCVVFKYNAKNGQNTTPQIPIIPGVSNDEESENDA